MDQGAPFPTYADHQRVPHWEIGTQLGILDMESGAKLAGSMFALYRGAGSRLVRALGSFALDRHASDYEEIHPPSFALSETMCRRVTYPNHSTTCTPSNATVCGPFPLAKSP